MEKRTGWRWFECAWCETHWIEATRDYLSPSEETCTCGDSVQPYKGMQDSTLQTDSSGNLLKYQKYTLTKEIL